MMSYVPHWMLMCLQEQYIFIHDAILESVTCGNTEISSANLKLEFQKMSDDTDPHTNTTALQTQFKVNYLFKPSLFPMYMYVGAGAGFS